MNEWFSLIQVGLILLHVWFWWWSRNDLKILISHISNLKDEFDKWDWTYEGKRLVREISDERIEEAVKKFADDRAAHHVRHIQEIWFSSLHQRYYKYLKYADLKIDDRGYLVPTNSDKYYNPDDPYNYGKHLEEALQKLVAQYHINVCEEK